MLSERLNPQEDPPECYHGFFLPDCEECTEREWHMALDFYDRADAEYERKGDR